MSSQLIVYYILLKCSKLNVQVSHPNIVKKEVFLTIDMHNHHLPMLVGDNLLCGSFDLCLRPIPRFEVGLCINNFFCSFNEHSSLVKKAIKKKTALVPKLSFILFYKFEPEVRF